MGTPVPSREVEMAVKNCIDPNKIEIRQMTPEERKHYDCIGKPSKRIASYGYKENTEISEEGMDEKVAKKINPPERQLLVDKLGEVTGKSKAMKHVAKLFAVSIATVYVWFKDLDIKFDDEGKVIDDYFHQVSTEIPKADQQVGIREHETEAKEYVEGSKQEVITIDSESPVQFEYLEDPNAPNELTFAAQPGKGQVMYPEEETIKTSTGIVPKIHYSTYDVGTVLVEVDFKEELIRIGESKEMTFEEAAAVVELINEIL